MPQLIWTPAALLDVQRLYRFLAEKDLNSAKRAVATIRNSIKIIAHQPNIGRPAKDMAPEFREWPVDFGNSGYLVLYRFNGVTAVILAIRHQSETGY